MMCPFMSCVLAISQCKDKVFVLSLDGFMVAGYKFIQEI